MTALAFLTPTRNMDIITADEMTTLCFRGVQPGHEQYTSVREIGAGSFGKVYCSRNETNGREVALKVLYQCPEAADTFDHEVSMLVMVRNLQCQFLVQYIESFITDAGLYCIATELVAGGCLQDCM